MNLYILRHGIAVEPGTEGHGRDADRPLTPKGKAKLRKIAKAMKRLEVAFDLILSSPYRRARQTAEIIAGVLHCRRRLEFTDRLAASESPAKCVELLAQLDPPPDNVLLVGHEPYLSSLVSWLISGGSQAAIVLKKGGLCKLTTDSLQSGRCARLEWLLTPKHLAWMT